MQRIHAGECAPGEMDGVQGRLADYIAQQWSADSAAALQHFAAAYYQGVAAEDLLARPLDRLYAVVVEHWLLGQERRAATPLIRIYNPELCAGEAELTTVVDLVVDDVPFLIDSLSMVFQTFGLRIHQVVHPVLSVSRDAQGRWLQLQGEGHGACEAYMHFEIDRCSDAEQLATLRGQLLAVLTEVQRAVDDWQPMRACLQAARDALQHQPPREGGADRLDEALALLDWVVDGHFLFLGYRYYDLRGEAATVHLEPLAESSLGVLRSASAVAGVGIDESPAELLRSACDAEPLVLTASSSRSPVQRPGYMDSIGVKRFDVHGRVIGEHRFLGRYSAASHYQSAQGIPLLRRKVAAVLQRAGYSPVSHAGKALLNILESYPRDELFEVDGDTLERMARAILQLQNRQRIRLLVRPDRWQRFAYCHIFVPREGYDTRSRWRIQAILEEALGAERTDSTVQIGESPLAHLRLMIRLGEVGLPALDIVALERRLVEALRSWEDGLQVALVERHGEEVGRGLYRRYVDAFGAAYREAIAPRAALEDIEQIERFEIANGPLIRLYRDAESDPCAVRLRLFSGARPSILADVLSVLEHLGLKALDESSFKVTPLGRSSCWIQDFGLRWQGGDRFEPELVEEAFQDAIVAIWRQYAEDDRFNRLILSAGLDWRQVVLIRALVRYLLQVGTTFSQAYMEEVLASYPRIVCLLVRYFQARFDPDASKRLNSQETGEQIEALLNDVASLDADRILRRLYATVQAVVRTNYFSAAQTDPLAFKLQPAGIPGLPQPVPWAEIFVYSPQLEGVHLRSSAVARGGIRWSDRREDFRSEVLGLMKAQIVKNALIVPMGAKGGFVLKGALPSEPAALRDAVRRAYRAYIGALLDVTDNRVDGEISGPSRMVRLDGDDPYLVVAADKGTATFSDLANSVSAERRFWLGDAFASGGSAGYDHKRMGITARGAWLAVQRHFRTLGCDVQREPFTAVGIGDMSGDVFGNGMLLSPHIRLVAAFDHRHIFIDPDPDPAVGYAERRRLFELDRSSWDDYDRAALSVGGGVYSRSVKAISLSPEAQGVLGMERERVTPDELIRALLCAPVDLLWNGGIGTYVKAGGEDHTEVGDKASEAVRVDAEQLRCRVIGEGGNLGLTQRARIAFAAAGGLVNGDFVDNAGGVACSDLEVNIKILLNEAVAEGALTVAARDELLASMTDEVAEKVLAACDAQCLALSLAQATAAEQRHEHAALLRDYEAQGLFVRRFEALPDDDLLAERAAAGSGLLRPELAVVNAYTKILVRRALLAGSLPDESIVAQALPDYFPRALNERFAQRTLNHPLRRELVATTLAGRIVNRMGETFYHRIEQRTGASVTGITRAWLVAAEMLSEEVMWRAVQGLTATVPSSVQADLFLRLSAIHEHFTIWVLRNMGVDSESAAPDLDTTAVRVAPLMRQLLDTLPGLLPQSEREIVIGVRQKFEAAGVPPELAQQFAVLPSLSPALDWLRVADSQGAELFATAACYSRLVEALDGAALRAAIVALGADDPWQERFRAGLLGDYDLQMRALIAQLLSAYGAQTAAVDDFLAAREPVPQRLKTVVEALKLGGAAPSAAMLAVAVQELKGLVQAGDARRLRG